LSERIRKKCSWGLVTHLGLSKALYSTIAHLFKIKKCAMILKFRRM